MNLSEEDFFNWHKTKLKLNNLNESKFSNVYLKEREMWWCHCGLNIGQEQNGKNENFERPVVVLKKINKNLFIGVPTTTQDKKKPYQFYVGHSEIKDISGKIIKLENYALWKQIKIYSSRRLIRKINMVDRPYFNQLRSIIKDFL